MRAHLSCADVDEFGKPVKKTPTDLERIDRNAAEQLLSFYFEEKTSKEDYIYDENTKSKYRINHKKT